MKKTTITHARTKLARLWDKIERTRKPLTISRTGHEDMVLLPAADWERLQDAAIAPFLARLGTDIDEHPERLNGFPAELVAGMKKVTEGVPIDHDAEIEGAGTHLLDELTAKYDAQFERMQDPEVWAATLRGFHAPLGNVRPAAADMDDDREVRQARINGLARHVWHDNANDVAAFLSTPHALLGGRTPNECSATERDTAMVEGVLLRLAFGVSG